MNATATLAPAQVDTTLPARQRNWTSPALVGLLVATAVCWLIGLSRSGWANAFYAAAAEHDVFPGRGQKVSVMIRKILEAQDGVAPAKKAPTRQTAARQTAAKKTAAKKAPVKKAAATANPANTNAASTNSAGTPPAKRGRP